MPGVVFVKVAVGQVQKTAEQCHTKIVDQPQGDLGQKIAAKERADPLPSRDRHDQQRHHLQQFDVLQEGDVREHRRLRVTQPIDEILEDPCQHRLAGREDNVAEDAQREIADVGLHVAEQAEVDFQAGGAFGAMVSHGHAA